MRAPCSTPCPTGKLVSLVRATERSRTRPACGSTPFGSPGARELVDHQQTACGDFVLGRRALPDGKCTTLLYLDSDGTSVGVDRQTDHPVAMDRVRHELADQQHRHFDHGCLNTLGDQHVAREDTSSTNAWRVAENLEGPDRPAPPYPARVNWMPYEEGE
jgi:hypothetical protein